MRIVYIGALTGGRKNLEALAGAGFRPLAVFTLDESHAGASCYEPFDSTAGRLGLRLFKVRNIRKPMCQMLPEKSLNDGIWKSHIMS